MMCNGEAGTSTRSTLLWGSAIGAASILEHTAFEAPAIGGPGILGHTEFGAPGILEQFQQVFCISH